MLDPSDFPNAVAFAFEAVGGIGAAAKVCDRSYQALNKWRLTACLPRTDYTGETRYADLLSIAAKHKGNPFESIWLLDAAVPQKAGAQRIQKQGDLSDRPAPPDTHHHSAVGSCQR